MYREYLDYYGVHVYLRSIRISFLYSPCTPNWVSSFDQISFHFTSVGFYICRFLYLWVFTSVGFYMFGQEQSKKVWDEKGCLSSTEKKAAVDLDDTALFLVGVRHVDDRQRSTC